MPRNTAGPSGELSIGDVIKIETGSHSHWLACDPFTWRPIAEPSHRSGQPLSAATVYQHLADQRLLRERLRRRGADCREGGPP